MDTKIGKIGSAVVILGVVGFAVCMLKGPITLCYGSSIAIAFGMMLMNSAFYRFSRPDAKAAAMCAVAACNVYPIVRIPR